MAHPDYDEFWKRQTLIPHIRDVKVPTLNVAGWWDQEDFYGPLRIYEALERHDTKRRTSSSSAPGTTAAGASRRAIVWGRSRSTARPPSTSASKSRPRGSPTSSRTRGGSTCPRPSPSRAGRTAGGAGTPGRPTANTEERRALLRARGSTLLRSPQRPRPTTPSTRMSPTRRTRCRTATGRSSRRTSRGGSKWSTWLVEDQRFVDDRDDVLSWETGPLDKDLTIAGEVVAHSSRPRPPAATPTGWSS